MFICVTIRAWKAGLPKSRNAFTDVRALYCLLWTWKDEEVANERITLCSRAPCWHRIILSRTHGESRNSHAAMVYCSPPQTGYSLKTIFVRVRERRLYSTVIAGSISTKDECFCTIHKLKLMMHCRTLHCRIHRYGHCVERDMSGICCARVLMHNVVQRISDQ